MRADANRAGDEQDGNQARADRLEFCEAEGVSSTGRPTGQPPREQNDEIAQKVYKEMACASVLGFVFQGVRVRCQSRGVDTSAMIDRHAGACGRGQRPPSLRGTQRKHC